MTMAAWSTFVIQTVLLCAVCGLSETVGDVRPVPHLHRRQQADSAFLDDDTVAEAERIGVRECVSKDQIRALADIVRRHCLAA